CVGDVRGLEIQSPQLRQPGEIGEAEIGDARVGKIELGQVREAGQVLDPGVADGCAAQIELRESRHAGQAAHAFVVERAVVVEIEVLQIEAGEGGAGNSSLMNTELSQFGQRLETGEDCVVERNVGLDRLAQDQLLEVGGAG